MRNTPWAERRCEILVAVAVFASLCGACKGARQSEGTNMAACVYPEARLQEVQVSSWERGLLFLNLFFGTQEEQDSVVDWYRQRYGQLCGSGGYDVIELDGPWGPLLRFRQVPPGPEPIGYPFVRVTRAPASIEDGLRIFHGREEDTAHRVLEDRALETKIEVAGQFAEPVSGRERSMTPRQERELIALWEDNHDEFLAAEAALELYLQYPDAKLVDTSLDEALEVGYVTVVLTFAAAARPSVVADHYRAELGSIGTLEEIENTDPAVQYKLRIDQGGPHVATLSIGAAGNGADDRQPETEAAKADSTVYTWRFQRPGPWIRWAINP